MSEPDGLAAYEFGAFRLDPRQRLLLSRDTGRPLALTPKAFEILLHLVQRRGQLVEKPALMRAIWPNVVVEENNLNQSISALRRVLGENPGEHRFIVTLPGRGYRFVAEVKELASAAPAGAAAEAAPNPLTVASASEIRASIAVLPLANLTGETEKEYFSDGMAEELIHRLARVPGLRVAARTSTFAYKGRNTDVRQIARDLGVAAVLEGSVRGAGERVRVTAQLVDGRSGYQLWSQSYDREFGDLFKLQDELAAAIVQALGTRMNVKLPAGEPLPGRPTESLEAYQLYLQGNAIRGRVGGGLRRAEELYQRAIALDPRFARAHCALAHTYVMAVVVAHHWPGALEDAEREASTALLLDENLAEAAIVLGQTHAFRGNWLAAEVHFKAALSRDQSLPVDVPIHGLFLLSVGFVRAACEEAAAAFQAAPAAPAAAATVAIFSSLSGNDSDALKYVDLAISLGASDDQGAMPLVCSHAHRRAGRFAEAGECATRALPAVMRDLGGADVVRQVFAAMGDPGKKAEASLALHELQQRGNAAGVESNIMVLLAMDWHTSLGNLDRAFATALDALTQRKRSGSIGAWGAMWLPELRPLHRDPRFQAFTEQLGLMEYWKQFGPPDHFELREGRLVCR
jgi:TolB-like protein